MADNKTTANLQAHIHYRGYALGVGLDCFPRLAILKVFITHAGDTHGILESLAEMEGLDVVGERHFQALHFGKRLIVDIEILARSGGYAFIIFMSKHGHTVDEVAKDSGKLVVVACLEVGPCKVVILGFGSVGCEYVAKHILLAGEIDQVFVEPHRPVARSRDFVTLEVEELVGGHIVGKLETVAVSHHHGGEHDAVEHYIILADKVDDAAFGVFPPLLPCIGQQFFCI